MPNVVRPHARLISPATLTEGNAALDNIVRAARVSHRSEDTVTGGDAFANTRFLRAVVLGHGDWSVVEHQSAQVEFVVDRGITHEIVRHRLFSFTQESTRFVNYEKRMPPSFLCPFDENDEPAYGIWYRGICSAEASYKALLAEGKRPQEARSVFPNALAAKLIMTGNLRSWRWFLLMRTTKEAHPQMREVTIPLLAQFKERVPVLFEDIEPEARQVENAQKAH